MSRILKKSWMPLAIILILMAIFFSLFRALTPWAKQYKGKVEEHLSILLGQPVTINDLETSWYWFEPVLKMDQVTVSDQHDHNLKLNKLLIGINLFSSLWHWQIQPGVLYIEDVHLTLHQTNDHWDIDGLSNDRQSVSFDAKSYLPVLGWILSQQKIILKHISALIYFNDGTLIPLEDLNLITHHSYGHYRVKGSATLQQKIPTELAIIADMQLDPYQLKNASGHAYLALHHFLPQQWQPILPNMPFHASSGEGNLEVWLDLVKGHFFSLQSKINFERLIFTQEGQSKRHSIPFINANLAWRTTTKGWELTGDQITFRIDGITWPENSIRLKYNQIDQSYDVFLKQLSLKSLLALDVAWPETMLPIVSMHPEGELEDTRLLLKANGLNYALTRFEHLGWQRKANIPAVNELSGVLYWQPTEGRLELNGENTKIEPHNLPPLVFDQLNTAIEWKQLSNGFRVSVERFVLNRSDLVLSAEGTLDNAFLPSANLRLNADFSAKDARHWLDYIPDTYLKPKLNDWLKHDIKKIGKASGRVTINGPIANFPFDHDEGEFLVNSYLNDVNLVFAKNWPVTRNIDAHLSVSRRELDAEIFHADLKDIPIEQMSLVIYDLGLGKENLLIHGVLKAPGDKMEKYIFASPLSPHLNRLKKIEINDLLGLDLRLEIPLYTESDHVFVRGDLIFDHNQVIFHNDVADVKLDKMSGSLQFDEDGITHGALSGDFFEDPVRVTIQSVRKKKPYTAVNIDSVTSIKVLRNALPFPVFNVLEGKMNVNGLLTLSNHPNDLDHIHITSSMQGVAVDLPAPLGKTKTELAPLVLDVDYNAETVMDALLTYKDFSLKAKKMDKDDWLFSLQEAAVAATLRYQPIKHTLSGNVERLYLDHLNFLNNHLKNTSNPIKPMDIPNLNLTFDALRIENVDLGQVSLKSTSAPTQWTLEYCKIKSPDYLFTAQGLWQQTGKQNQTTVQAELGLTDLAAALARFNILPAVAAHRGNIRFKGGWAGAIHDFSLQKVVGDVQILIKEGRITNLDKQTEEKLGLGKLLSILSLQTIPRRLKLDFSDLSKGGYSFDEFKGDFILKNGIMSTQNSYLDGPVAYAGMKGDLDLVKRLYDVDLRVSPYITASLPIVATIAGGPIAGIATWVASKIINKGMQQISAYTYKVSGPWADPIVQQVHLYRKKLSNVPASEQRALKRS